MIVAVHEAGEALSLASAWEIVGGLSRPSKMPGYAYGLPAKACKTGSKLVGVPGSVCAGCYALKGNYRFGSVKSAQQRRLESLQHPRWVEAMITLLHALDIRWFRWHDSGDIQSPSHLERSSPWPRPARTSSSGCRRARRSSSTPASRSTVRSRRTWSSGCPVPWSTGRRRWASRTPRPWSPREKPALRRSRATNAARAARAGTQE